MSTKVWTSKKINLVLKSLNEGSAEEPDLSCFYKGDINLRASNLTFDYTPEEQREIVKCANDVEYFANTYCNVMTDEGIARIKLRSYQKKMLKTFQDNRYVIMMASRQIGKCLLFNSKIELFDTKTNSYYKLSIGSLYFAILKSKRKLTFIEKLKFFLWRQYDKLDS